MLFTMCCALCRCVPDVPDRHCCFGFKCGQCRLPAGVKPFRNRVKGDEGRFLFFSAQDLFQKIMHTMHQIDVLWSWRLPQGRLVISGNLEEPFFSFDLSEHPDDRLRISSSHGSPASIRRRISVPLRVWRSYNAGDWTLMPDSLKSWMTRGFEE